MEPDAKTRFFVASIYCPCSSMPPSTNRKPVMVYPQYCVSVSLLFLQNHISVDAEAVLNLMVFQMFMWGALIRLISCIIMLFWVLGISAVSGLSLVFLSLPINKVRMI